LEVPLCQFSYVGEEPPRLPNPRKRKLAGRIAWGSAGENARYLNRQGPMNKGVRCGKCATESEFSTSNFRMLDNSLDRQCWPD